VRCVISRLHLTCYIMERGGCSNDSRGVVPRGAIFLSCPSPENDHNPKREGVALLPLRLRAKHMRQLSSDYNRSSSTMTENIHFQVRLSLWVKFLAICLLLMLLLRFFYLTFTCIFTFPNNTQFYRKFSFNVSNSFTFLLSLLYLLS